LTYDFGRGLDVDQNAGGADGSENLKVKVTIPQRADDDPLDGPMGSLVATITVAGVVMKEVSAGVL
jgi:hypothetical protein